MLMRLRDQTLRVAAAVTVSLVTVGFAMAHGEAIRFGRPSLEMRPGDRVSVLVLLEDSATPLFGYSLDVEIAGLSAPDGLVANVIETNFFDSHNLITAGGEVRDPLFSVIRSAPHGGVFLSTNTMSGAELLAEPGVNDVLAELVFDASTAARGEYLISFGTGTVLSTARGEPVHFEASTLSIAVIPAPATLGAFVVMSGFCVPRRRRG